MHRHTNLLRQVFQLAAVLTLTVSCGGGDATAPDPPRATSITISPKVVALSWIGESSQITAQVRDQNDAAMTGQAVSWSSSNPSVATVSSDGLVAAAGQGATTVIASSGTASQSASVTVNPAVASITKISGDAQQADVGAALPDNLVVEVRDQGGTPIAGASVSWAVMSGGGIITSSQDQADEAGRALAQWTLGGTAGAQSVRASTGDLAVVFTADAVSETNITITSVTPSPIQEGQQAVITGSGLAGASVQVGGAAAAIVASSNTQITFTVPITPCQPSRMTELRIQAGAAVATRGTTVVPRSLLEPFPFGQIWLSGLHPQEGQCLHIEPTAQSVSYLIGVQSLAEAASTLTPVNLSMGTGIAAASPSLARVAAAPSSLTGLPEMRNSFPSPPTARSPSISLSTPRMIPDTRQLLHSRAHLEHRSRAREELQGLLVAGRLALSPRADAPARIVPLVGDQIEVRVPESCDEFSTITTVVRIVGNRSIWLEDLANPAGGISQEDYQNFSSQYDNVIGARLDSYAGSPTDLDGNERVVVVVTKEVNNNEAGILGFVYSVDLFPEVCPAGNGGEYFYGIAPDPIGLTNSQITLEDVLDRYPRLIAHEVTHVIHDSHQLQTAGFPTVWEGEGIATFMQELVGHGFTGLGSGQNLGPSVFWAHRNWYGSMMQDLVGYFGFDFVDSKVVGAPQECSWIDRPPNGPCLNDSRMPYGVPASLFRWLADQTFTPFTESQMTRAIISSETHGLDLLTAITGDVGPEELSWLMAYWAIAIVADDEYFGSGMPTFKSWDFRALYNSFLHADAIRPAPAERGHSFSESFNVRAGSTAYFIVSGSHGQISFGATGLPAHMNLWVVRIE